MTLPLDGREWDDLQMKEQRDDFVRDSIRRAPAAATRVRELPQKSGHGMMREAEPRQR
jgi:hypothetical protein